MGTVAHTLPSGIIAAPGMQVGYHRPIEHVDLLAGGTRSRDAQRRNLREYQLTPKKLDADSFKKWRAFLDQVHSDDDIARIPEFISGTHRELICGPITNGTRTTFAIPVIAPTDVTVFVDGVPQDSGAYTIHSAANLATDAQAGCEDADNTTVTNATDSDDVGSALDGLASVAVAPTGGANPNVWPVNFITGLSAAEEYTGVAAVLCTNSSDQNYRLNISWFESDDTIISTTTGSDVAVASGDGWTVLSSTATSPALTAKGRVTVQRNDTSGTDVFCVDCFGLIPGDYDTWHLPSQAPGSVEFNTAPAIGKRVTAIATGKRVTRCRLTPGSQWSFKNDYASVRSVRAIETPEV